MAAVLYPILNGGRREQRRQFVADNRWQNDAFEKDGENVNMPNQDQVIERAGVGDNHRHSASEP
jgi:hypothetical protein